MAINPTFLYPINTDVLVESVQQINGTSNSLKHQEVFKNLLGQFSPIDFRSKVFPEYEDLQNQLEACENEEEKAKIRDKLAKFKLQDKHYYITCIDEIDKVAVENDWDLVKFNDEIYLYNGAFWQSVDTNTFQIFLSKVAGRLGVPNITQSHYIFRENLFKQFSGTQLFASPEVNNEEVNINLLDCTLSIINGEVISKPFDKKSFLTYQLPFKYEEDAKCPIFSMFLDEVLPDKSTQLLLAEYLGFLFIRNGNKNIKIEKMLVLYGSGANGKSVLFDIILALLGKDNVSNFSLSAITDTSGYYRAQMASKILNYGSEIGGKSEADMLKKMASGEPIEARQPYGRAFTLYDYPKLMFNCNKLPKDIEHTDAYFRRFQIIPFSKTIPEDEQDPELASKIIETELSGILIWVLSGLKRVLINKKFTWCELSENELKRYRVESDSVQMFIEDLNITKSSENYKPFKTILKAYQDYCLENGFKPLNSLNLMKRLEGLKYNINRRNIGKVVYCDYKDQF